MLSEAERILEDLRRYKAATAWAVGLRPPRDRAIRHGWALGLSGSALADASGVSRAQVSRIVQKGRGQ